MRKYFSLKSNPFGLAITLCIALLIISVLISVGIQQDDLRIGLSNLVFSLVNLLSVAALFYAYQRSRLVSHRRALPWGILTLAQVLYFLADLLWSLFESVYHIDPFPSAADALYIAYYPLFVIGILLLRSHRLTPTEKYKQVLDMAIVMFAALIGFWNFLIGPLAIQNNGEPIMMQVLYLSYPVLDLVLLWAALVLLYQVNRSDRQAPILLLAVGTVAMIFSDVFFSYKETIGLSTSGNLEELGWLIGYMLTGLAAILHGQTVFREVQNPKTVPATVPPASKLVNWLTFLPYIWIIGAYLVLLQNHSLPDQRRFDITAAGVGLVIGLVLLRQITALIENFQLYNRLQKAMDRVQTQTSELIQANQELQVEISERKKAELQLAFDTLHDSLTGLPNRVLFLDRLERAIAYTQRRSDYPFSVLFLDIDSFKVINDSLGHAAGDQILIAIAVRLKNCLRASDTIARLGGDEFVVLLEDTHDECSVGTAAIRIQEALKKPFTHATKTIFVTASIGIILSVHGYEKADDVLRDADIAMYQAKSLGKARYEIFDTNLRQIIIARMEIENDLHQGLEQQQFVLHYQPIISLGTDKILGFEALVRWNHPSRGLLMPVDFIKVAEDTGLIIPLGAWVLQEACRQIMEWQQTYSALTPLTINVNISGKQFAQPGLIDQIIQTLIITGLPASQLKLEITETALIEHSEYSDHIFEKLNEMGVQLQVDDFGTGYSSLSYLQRFPIHAIKIDRSFIDQMGKKEHTIDLVRTMVMMAHDLGVDAVAEGVETQEQRDELTRLNCKYGQGFLMSRPIDPTAAATFLEKRMQM